MSQCNYELCEKNIDRSRLKRGAKYCSDPCRWAQRNLDEKRRKLPQTAIDVFEAAMDWYGASPEEGVHAADRLIGACVRHAKESGS